MSPVFEVRRRDGGIAHLVVDHPARKLNVLDADAVSSLEAALTDLEAAPPQGVIVLSGKPGSFIAGADVDAIGAVDDAVQVLAMIRRGQTAYARLAALPCATVAAIDGVCLGVAPNWRWLATHASRARNLARRSACPRSCSASCPRGAARRACRA